MSLNPYESPAAGSSSTKPSKAATPFVFRPSHNLVKSLLILFGILFTLTALILVMEIVSVALLGDLAGDVGVDDEGNITNPRALGVAVVSGCLGFLSLPINIATAVVFCVWVNRSNKNARALGAENMSFTPGWAVGWFFVPIANLWKPFHALREIYQASDPDSGPGDWMQSHVPTLFNWWWGFWLISNFTGQAETRMSLRGSVGAEVLAVAIISSVFDLGACLLVMKVVRITHARQIQKSSRPPTLASTPWDTAANPFSGA